MLRSAQRFAPLVIVAGGVVHACTSFDGTGPAPPSVEAGAPDAPVAIEAAAPAPVDDPVAVPPVVDAASAYTATSITDELDTEDASAWDVKLAEGAASLDYVKASLDGGALPGNALRAQASAEGALKAPRAILAKSLAPGKGFYCTLKLLVVTSPSSQMPIIEQGVLPPPSSDVRKKALIVYLSAGDIYARTTAQPVDGSAPGDQYTFHSPVALGTWRDIVIDVGPDSAKLDLGGGPATLLFAHPVPAPVGQYFEIGIVTANAATKTSDVRFDAVHCYVKE